MEPVRLGRVPAGRGTADLFISVESDAQPLLRIDLYGSSDEEFAFTEVQLWSRYVAIGWGEHIYLVDPETREAVTIGLGSYFGHLYPVASNLLVASAECLFAISPNATVLWRTDRLGVDGVIVNRVTDAVIEGEGEWDPPGHWRPFSVSLQNGRST